jgi:hypothetical protein
MLVVQFMQQPTCSNVARDVSGPPRYSTVLLCYRPKRPAEAIAMLFGFINELMNMMGEKKDKGGS